MSEAYAEPEQPIRRSRGRPSLFTLELADEICERIAQGEPLQWICRDDHMPSVQAVADWQRAHPDFSVNFAQARVAGYDAIAAETLEIADDASNDWMERKGEEDQSLGWVLNGEHIQRSKLRIETRLKLLAKWDPKRYGERLDLNATTTTTVHLVDSTDIAALDNDQREALKEIANALLAQRTAGKAISHWEDVDHEAIEGELSNKR